MRPETTVIAEHVSTYHSDDVAVAEAEGKGRILVAARDFDAGERILIEYPLVEVEVAKAAPAYEALVALRAAGQLEAAPPLFYWAALSTLTSIELEGVRCSAWRTVPAQTQYQALHLHAPPEACEAPSTSTLAVVADLWPRGAGPDAARLDRLLQSWIYNSFDQGGGDDALEAGGLYLGASMLSHSCAPNAGWHLDESNSFHLHARQQVNEGEEITIPYLSADDLGLPTPDRRAMLSATKDFMCSCERCMAPLDDTRVFRCPRCEGDDTAAAAQVSGEEVSGDKPGAIVCCKCGDLTPEEAAPLLAAERLLRLWARRQPQFHPSSSPDDSAVGATAGVVASEVTVFAAADGSGFCDPNPAHRLQSAEAGGVAGLHWGLDAARAAAATAAETPAEACSLQRQRVAAYASAPRYALSKHARLCFALGQSLSGKSASPEALQEAAHLHTSAARGFVLLFGDEDPEYREALKQGVLVERRLTASSRSQGSARGNGPQVIGRDSAAVVVTGGQLGRRMANAKRKGRK